MIRTPRIADQPGNTGPVRYKPNSLYELPIVARIDASTKGCFSNLPWIVACRVADHACEGVAPVGPAREAIQHPRVASRIQLVHQARAACSTLPGSPVEVACRVADHTGVGGTPLR